MNVSFDRLPPQVCDQLERFAAGRPPEGGRFVPLEGNGGKIAAIVFGLLVLGGVAGVAALSDPWVAGGAGVAGVASWIAAMMVLFNWIRVKEMGRSRVKPGLVITPLLIGRTGLDSESVEMHYHKDLKNCDITHVHSNGSYQHTTFVLDFSTGRFNFVLGSRSLAEDVLTTLRSMPGFLKRWLDDGSIEENIRTFDWIGAAAEQAPSGAGAPRARGVLVRSGWARFGVSVGAAALFTGAAWGANLVVCDQGAWSRATRDDTSHAYRRYLSSAPLKWHRGEATIRFDDRSYSEAAAKQTAAALRGYMRAFSAGRHVAEARQAMRDLYRAAEEAYLAKAQKADPQAAEGMKALLAHLSEKDSPQARIVFQTAGAADAEKIAEAVREQTKSSKVQGFGAQFSADANRERESRIVAVMRASFSKVFSDDLFDLQPGDPASQEPRFLVRWRVVGSGDLYTWEREKHLDISQREIYPGILIEFDFSLQVPGSAHPPDPDPEKGWRFSTTGQPAPNFSVSGSDAAAVYDRMVATAFEEFEVRLANAYGLELVMPKDWGQLPGEPEGGRPDSAPFDSGAFRPPVIDPDLLDPGRRFRFPGAAGKTVDQLIEEVMTDNILSLDKLTVEQAMRQVRSKARFTAVVVPGDEVLRPKVEAKLAIWQALLGSARKKKGDDEKKDEKKDEEEKSEDESEGDDE